MTDQEFIEQLEKHLGPGAVVPLFYNDDKSINREKTLNLPCFWNFKQ